MDKPDEVKLELKRKKHREYMRKWYAEHPGYRRTQYEKHGGPLKMQEYRARNPDKTAAQLRRAYWKDPEKARLRNQKRYAKRNKEKVLYAARKSNLKLRYGLTPAEYATMHAAQNGVCAICGGTNARYKLSVDHNHTTGQLRELLCGRCNVALGNFRDDPLILHKALKYLCKHST